MSELQAGRELDALVAERVMGWSGIDWKAGYYAVAANPVTGIRQAVSQYSTDIGSAWLVVERLRGEGHNLNIKYYSGCWYVDFFGAQFVDATKNRPNAYATDPESVPLAICRAALAALPDPPHDSPPST